MNVASLQKSLLTRRELASPKPNVFAVAPLKKTGMPDVLGDFIRVFSAIQFEKGRRPSKHYDPGFDMKKHVLSDSPTSIAWRMGKDWRDYTRHAIVQIGVCNFRCFYCYVDYDFLTGKNVMNVRAQDIVDQFLDLRQKALAEGSNLNVLRISGGEPMLVPDLTIEVLRIIKKMGLDDQIGIKTETNLSPLATDEEGTCVAEKWADLKELSSFKNFIMHPTFHGIDKESLGRVSGAKWDSYDIMISGLQKLIDLKIEFFPSFGSNVYDMEDVVNFFDLCKSVHPNLPGRIAVREFNVNYDAPLVREHGAREIKLVDPIPVMEKWDSLLRKEYGVGYGETPRHSFNLY